jgi:hypothetical protein
MVLFAVIHVKSFISATNDNARIDLLRTHGIPVTVVDCIGNIGSNGSKPAGCSFRGDYTVSGTTYHELIDSMTTFSAFGAAVSDVADPSQHSTVVLASTVRTSVASPRVYVPWGCSPSCSSP